MAKAALIQSMLSGFTDSSGNPLASGKVYTYDVGTTTPKSVYTDEGATSAAANPVILGANGAYQAYGYGRYKFVVKTAADVTVATYDNLEFNDYNSIWVPVVTAGGAMTVSSLSVSIAYYHQRGRYVRFNTVLSFTLGGVADPTVYITFPVTANNSNTAFTASRVDGGVAGQCYLSSATLMAVQRYDAANWTLAASRVAYVSGEYIIP